MSAVLDLKVVPLGVFGAEVQGVDLAHAAMREIDAIKNAWYRHDVLLFRNQQLTDDDLLSFSRHFGTLDSPPNQGAGRKSPPGYPEVYIVSNVRDEKGEGHAVLTARTTKGDYILDNKTDELKLWSRTSYAFVMRQSYIDPNFWLSLNPKDQRQPALLGGTREGP